MHSPLDVRTTVWRKLVATTAVLLLLLAGCGGDDDPDEAVTEANAVPVTTSIPEPTSTPVIIPTSTPLPTATPLPTSTPVPLDSPTPSAILIGSAFTNDSKVTTVGIDEVFFGMTPTEAGEAASTEWLGDSSSTATCYKVAPAAGPNGIELWIVDGFVERIDVRHPDLRTPSKLGVGNTIEELKSQLGERLTEETTEDGRATAVFTPTDAGDRDFRLIFDLVDGAVASYSSGRVGVIERVPGDCFSSINSTE